MSRFFSVVSDMCWLLSRSVAVTSRSILVFWNLICRLRIEGVICVDTLRFGESVYVYSVALLISILEGGVGFVGVSGAGRNMAGVSLQT